MVIDKVLGFDVNLLMVGIAVETEELVAPIEVVEDMFLLPCVTFPVVGAFVETESVAVPVKIA